MSISEQMIRFYLNPDIDVSSRNSHFIERSVDWITSSFNIGAGKNIVDFGCGPGLYTTRLARRHAAVTGIAFSKRSIRYAQETTDREGLSIHYITRDYLNFTTDDRFHLILMIMCDFCALSPTWRKKILSTFHKLLESSGSVILDVYSRPPSTNAKRTHGTRPISSMVFGLLTHYGFLNTLRYEKEKVVLDMYTIIEAKRSRTIYNWLQYFSPEDVEREFVECGYAIEENYADVAGTPFSQQGRKKIIENRERAHPVDNDRRTPAK